MGLNAPEPPQPRVADVDRDRTNRTLSKRPVVTPVMAPVTPAGRSRIAKPHRGNSLAGAHTGPSSVGLPYRPRWRAAGHPATPWPAHRRHSHHGYPTMEPARGLAP